MISVPRARPLSDEEVQELRRRPWPKLPWWLWLTAAVTTAAAVAATVLLLQVPDPEQVPLGARRSPPPAGGDRSHGVGAWLAPALDPANQERVARHEAGCDRLEGVTVAGAPEDAALLRLAAREACAFRSTPLIDAARQGLRERRAVVAFAGFEATGNESTLLFDTPRQGQVTVLVNGKFQRGDPERVAVLLIHEGVHAAAGPTGSAEDELAARQAELAACRQAFPVWREANRGCRDAEALLNQPDPLAELQRAGYS